MTLSKPILKKWGPKLLVLTEYLFCQISVKPDRNRIAGTLLVMKEKHITFTVTGLGWSALRSRTSNMAFSCLSNSMAARDTSPIFLMCSTNLDASRRFAVISMNHLSASASFFPERSSSFKGFKSFFNVRDIVFRKILGKHGIRIDYYD